MKHKSLNIKQAIRIQLPIHLVQFDINTVVVKTTRPFGNFACKNGSGAKFVFYFHLGRLESCMLHRNEMEGVWVYGSWYVVSIDVTLMV